MAIKVKEKNNLITIQLNGSFDVSQYEEFKSICEGYKSPEYKFEIDFRNTLYVDSSALGMLLLLREQTKGDKTKVQLINVSGTVLRILEVAHFNQLFDVVAVD